MLCELWLAQKYLRAGKRQKIISFTALISMIGIAIGVLVLIVVLSVMTGFDLYLQDKMIGTNAHLLMDFYSGSKDYPALIKKIEENPRVVAAAPYIAGQAFAKIGPQVISVDMRGIDPQAQQRVSKIAEYLKQGSLELSGNEVIMGEELAWRLGLKLGDKIALISPVTLAKTDFSIKGLFNSGMYQYDATLLMTGLKSAQDFFKIPDLVSGIAIKTGDIYGVEALRQELYRGLGFSSNYEIRTWMDLNRNFLNALKLEKIVMFIVVTMTTVVAAFGIVSTLIMSVMSRVKDIGILRSIGAKTKSILGIFVFQGLSIGLAGILLGFAGGIWLSLSLNNIVDFISRVIGRSLIPKDIYYFDRIPVHISSPDVLMIVACAFVIALAASVYPAFFAARINPAEALRHE